MVYPEASSVTLHDTGGQEIPKEIHYIWLGKVMPVNGTDRKKVYPVYQDGIKYTMNVLRDRNYTFNLWLSIDDTSCEENEAWATSMGLNIRYIQDLESLEDVELWAIDKEKHTIDPEKQIEVPNYGAISDILRIVILYECGGIYLDTDCVFLQPLTDQMLKPKYGVLLPSSGNQKPSEKSKKSKKSRKSTLSSLFGCWNWCSCKGGGILEGDIGRPHEFVTVAIVNSILGSVPRGQVIQYYRQYVQEQYNQVLEKHGETGQEVLEFLFKDRKNGTLIRSGPNAMMISASVFQVNGENVWKFWNDFNFEFNEDRISMMFPYGYVHVQYENSWLQYENSWLVKTMTNHEEMEEQVEEQTTSGDDDDDDEPTIDIVL